MRGQQLDDLEAQRTWGGRRGEPQERVLLAVMPHRQLGFEIG